jgi:23S rRNA (guanosine2251-2'-O)-methyltransferase
LIIFIKVDKFNKSIGEINMKLAYGIHAVGGLLDSNTVRIIKVYVQPKPNKRQQELLDRCPRGAIEILSIHELDTIAKNSSHQGIVVEYDEISPMFGSLEELLASKKDNICILVLDGVVDPSNLGSCLRSAAAFNVDAIIIPKDRAVSVNATVTKVAAGAAQLVPVFSVTNLARALEQLAKEGVWLYGLSEHAEKHLHEHDLDGNIALVMGGEEKGIRDLTAKKCDYLVSLPTSDCFSTLNVAVATGITLYEVAKRRSA